MRKLLLIGILIGTMGVLVGCDEYTSSNNIETTRVISEIENSSIEFSTSEDGTVKEYYDLTSGIGVRSEFDTRAYDVNYEWNVEAYDADTSMLMVNTNGKLPCYGDLIVYRNDTEEKDLYKINYSETNDNVNYKINVEKIEYPELYVENTYF